jgi:multidrug efflux pump subunit AcrB
MVSYPGASIEVVDGNVAIPMEMQLQILPDLRGMTIISSQNKCEAYIEIASSASEKELLDMVAKAIDKNTLSADAIISSIGLHSGPVPSVIIRQEPVTNIAIQSDKLANYGIGRDDFVKALGALKREDIEKGLARVTLPTSDGRRVLLKDLCTVTHTMGPNHIVHKYPLE